MSYILYEGPSLLDGAPIVVLATGVDRPSGNPKTGPMMHTWILCRDIPPVQALHSGRDRSICGTCPLRKHVCYVNVHQAPLAIWWKYHRTPRRYVKALTHFGHGWKVRLGAYGDPAAVPMYIWETLTQSAAGHTGYTHQWRTCDPGLRRLCQASVEDEETAQQAQDMGWHTFRVKVPHEPKGLGEVLCPASQRETTCSHCMLCNGKKRNVVIDVHGGGRTRYKVTRFEAMKMTREAR